jgi:hypothetical protein
MRRRLLGIPPADPQPDRQEHRERSRAPAGRDSNAEPNAECPRNPEARAERGACEDEPQDTVSSAGGRVSHSLPQACGSSRTPSVPKPFVPTG